MANAGMDKLVQQWLNDPGFRQRMRVDPEGTVRGAGIQLSGDELAALRSVDWQMSDTELQQRLSKQC